MTDLSQPGVPSETSLDLVRSRSSGYDEPTLLRVAALVDTGLPVFHAFAQDRHDHPPTTRCSLCEGITDRGDHELCRARARHGRPTPLVPYLVSCGCVRCKDGVFDPTAYA